MRRSTVTAVLLVEFLAVVLVLVGIFTTLYLIRGSAGGEPSNWIRRAVTVGFRKVFPSDSIKIIIVTWQLVSQVHVLTRVSFAVWPFLHYHILRHPCGTFDGKFKRLRGGPTWRPRVKWRHAINFQPSRYTLSESSHIVPAVVRQLYSVLGRPVAATRGTVAAQ